MKHLLMIVALLTIPAAHAAPFAKADAMAGKKMHADLCEGCHAGRFGGDGARIYTRSERKVKNTDQLAQRISACNAMLGLNLFPDEEANLGAYLNKTFYKFK